MSSTKPQPASRIDQKLDGDRPFLIKPETNDLFVRTGKQIIEACQLKISLELWIQEFEGVCDEVARRLADNNRVRSCYSSPARGRITFFFAPQSHGFDFDLADELAALSLKLHRFNVGMVELQQVPWDEMDRFLDVSTAKRIFGEEFKPSESVDT